ncbi:MAG: hypothetical protein HYV90_03495 [Candidatus Woesebacteria bacterium]|nr:MAG: hypothetical protein HYV90_03495 [Candidatus Woesebacteria bacterium]
MESTNQEGPEDNSNKINLYKNPDYISLYRYENPSVPYDTTREGNVSRKDWIGAWYCDSLAGLKAYAIQRMEGEKGGRFVVVRIKRSDLEKYDVAKLPEAAEMDFESGNYIIPDAIGQESRVEIDGLFKETWEGKKNIPMADWQELENYIYQNLSDESLISRLQKP